MTEDCFIKAYQEFKEQIDCTKGGVLPEVDDLVHYMLLGVPRVPADEDPGEEARLQAIDQRVSIFKVIFVEINRDQSEGFVDEGLRRYDQAAAEARSLLEEVSSELEASRSRRSEHQRSVEIREKKQLPQNQMKNRIMVS